MKAYFVLKDTNELQPYFGVVKFFFKQYVTFTLHTTTDGTKTEVHGNLLAYVVISPRRFVNRCALAPAGKNSSSYYVIELPR